MPRLNKKEIKDLNDIAENNHKRHMKRSYSDLTDFATDSLISSEGTNKNNLDSNIYPDGLKNLLKSQFINHDIVQNLAKRAHKSINSTVVLEQLSLIRAMGEKDAEYNKRGWFGKWWYKKSHKQMMDQRDKMIKSLAARGADRNTLETLGMPDEKGEVEKPDMGKTIDEVFDKIETERESFEYDCEKYDYLILKQHSKEEEKMVQNINDKKTEVSNLRSKFIEVEEKMYQEYSPESYEQYQTDCMSKNAKFKGSYHDWIKSTKDDFKNGFKEWLNKQDNLSQYDYNHSYDEYHNNLKDLRADQKELEEFRDEFRAGKLDGQTIKTLSQLERDGKMYDIDREEDLQFKANKIADMANLKGDDLKNALTENKVKSQSELIEKLNDDLEKETSKITSHKAVEKQSEVKIDLSNTAF